MKTTKKPGTAIHKDLLATFKEVFGDDEELLNEALAEAERALNIVREDQEWHAMALNGEYELF